LGEVDYQSWVSVPGIGLRRLGLLISDDLQKQFIEMVGINGWCPGWCNEEKLMFLRNRVSEVKLGFTEGCFHPEWERRGFIF
jgi:hypothetical protein